MKTLISLKTYSLEKNIRRQPEGVELRRSKTRRESLSSKLKRERFFQNTTAALTSCKSEKLFGK